jgi:hypothetical protein
VIREDGSSPMTTKPGIEFVEIRAAYDHSGSPRAASYYVFQVAAMEVAVEVHKSVVMTRDGDLPPEKVKLAARTFLESELEQLGTRNLPAILVLDEYGMDSVCVHRLGCPPRF